MFSDKIHLVFATVEILRALLRAVIVHLWHHNLMEVLSTLLKAQLLNVAVCTSNQTWQLCNMAALKFFTRCNTFKIVTGCRHLYLAWQHAQGSLQKNVIACHRCVPILASFTPSDNIFCRLLLTSSLLRMNDDISYLHSIKRLQKMTGWRGKNGGRERESEKGCCLLFLSKAQYTPWHTLSKWSAAKTHNSSAFLARSPPGELARAPILQLRNLGPRTALGIKAIYKLSPPLRPPRRCLAPDPLPFIGFVLIAE